MKTKSRPCAPLSAFVADGQATAAVEFSLVLPVLMLLVFGAYQLEEATSAYRKVTLTARTVADLTTQYQTMGTSDVTTVLNASAQIMTPFDTSTLVIVLTEFTTDSSGKTTVTWSKSLNGTPLTAGATATLPANISQNSTAIVLATVTYKFSPAVLYKITSPYAMSSQMYMSPRSVQSISYTGT